LVPGNLVEGAAPRLKNCANLEAQGEPAIVSGWACR
jgi:hypothetical protein